jgi:uncharacterized protein YecE (DUF72 family)
MLRFPGYSAGSICTRMGQLYIGLSGYSYKPWQGDGKFYPSEIKAPQFLAYYATRYRSVEMDGTWYRMPSEKAVETWLAETPDSFKFCFKAHRQVTHYARLKPEAQDPLRFMLGRLGPLAKAGKLGPILVQLPPNLRRDDDRLRAFFDEAPTGFEYAIEFRHDSWKAPEVEQILADRSVAWVAAETDEAPAERRNTAPLVYARLRKLEYTNEELDKWVNWFNEQTAAGKHCYVYCKHEDDGEPWLWADRIVAGAR